MGIEDTGKWAYERQKQFEQAGQISLSVIEARVLLFLIARAMRFGSSEPHQFVNYLLNANIVSKQEYHELTVDQIFNRTELFVLRPGCQCQHNVNSLNHCHERNLLNIVLK